MTQNIRNIAIIAHVDHGKTTLVDRLLQQSGTVEMRNAVPERMLDSNDLERERGITILAKNTSLEWQGHRINIVDTPGHADFGGEVERILSMVDGVLLLVDAVDGPMPQTRFVTQKAFSHGLRAIVVINKCDRDGARPDWVLNQTFDLFDRLGASDAQLDFPVLYCSALKGYARTEPDGPEQDISLVFTTIIRHVPPPVVQVEGPLQLQISALDYSSYVGAIGIGRVARGRVARNQAIKLISVDGSVRSARVLQVLGFEGLKRVELPGASAGDIIAVTGIDGLRISDTLCDPARVEACPPLTVDEPTVSVTFEPSTSPFAGRDGRFVTSRQVGDRLERELIHNVALRVTAIDDSGCYLVCGRGELHLSILMENMRREGYEFSVGRPQVIVKMIDGVAREPYELLTVDIEKVYQGAVMESLGPRRGELQNMQAGGPGRLRLDYRIPARGLIGFRSEFLTNTAGTGLFYHVFDTYGPLIPGAIAPRNNGVLIANTAGTALAYALFNLQERGRLFVGPGTAVYEGMIIGIHSRANDLVVNPMKGKHLTNIRSAGNDENILLTPPIQFDLEQALEFIEDDELVEVTPKAIRVRKRRLQEHERKRTERAAALPR